MIKSSVRSVIFIASGVSPGYQEKRDTRFGVILDGEAENHDKTHNAIYQIHPVE